MDFDALSKARLAARERGVRRSGPTPGASGPSAVGMSSTYWATDDAPGFGGCVSASAVPAELDAPAATKIMTTAARSHWAREAFRESARGTSE